MNSFDQILQNWRDFYMLIGTAAATLMGLLFVGLSINLELLRGKANQDMRELAAQSGNNFFYALILAMVFLIPGQTPASLGLILIGCGLLSGLGTLAHWRNVERQKRSLGNTAVSRRFLLRILSIPLLVIAGTLIVFGVFSVLYVLILVPVFFLVSATQNAWDLLVTIRETSKE